MKCVSERLRDKFQNKRIALVGGAKHHAPQDVLDGYDYIVKVNYKAKLKKFHGLYLSADCAPIIDNDLKPEFVIFNTCAAHNGCMDKVTELYQRPGIELFPYCHHEGWFRELHNQIGSEPLTGCTAIRHFLDMGAAVIFVTGCDLYAKNFALPYQIGIHDIRKHHDWLIGINLNLKVFFDDTLFNVINLKNYYFPVKRSIPL